MSKPSKSSKGAKDEGGSSKRKGAAAEGGVVDQDMIYEAQDVRPLIETWVIRYATLLAFMMIGVASISLYASVRANMRSVRVFAVTEKGDTFQIPFYANTDEGQAAAAVLDADAGPSGPKLMSHVRQPF